MLSIILLLGWLFSRFDICSSLNSVFLFESDAERLAAVFTSPKRWVRVKLADRVPMNCALFKFHLPWRTISIPLVLVLIALLKKDTSVTVESPSEEALSRLYTSRLLVSK